MVLDEVKAAERCQLLTEQSSENALTALNIWLFLLGCYRSERLG
ncbi:MAG: hypothetical protein Ct9H300mP27_06630 [Chloroflexota bacterium]|nr:MAG: hypothetical protein Ct9H300mP27_06630 [Chloroflexota bacterium]